MFWVDTAPSRVYTLLTNAAIFCGIITPYPALRKEQVRVKIAFCSGHVTGDLKPKGGETISKFKPYIRQFFQRADVFLLVICTVCAIFGILMVDKAVVGMSAGGWDMSAPSKYIAVQTFSMFLGIGAFVLFTIIDADILGSQWKLLCVINVLLLVALIIFGQDDGTGNKSWIRFAGIGIQPSEVIKVLYIIVAAKQMTWLKEHRDIDSFLSIVEMAGHFVIVFGMIIVVSSDLGSATIIMFIFLTMFFVLGVKLYWFALGGAAVAAAVPLLWNYFLKDYQKKRLIAPYDPSIDPDGWGITWQTTQSKLTLASGRLTGVDEGHRATVFTGSGRKPRYDRLYRGHHSAGDHHGAHRARRSQERPPLRYAHLHRRGRGHGLPDFHQHRHVHRHHPGYRHHAPLLQLRGLVNGDDVRGHGSGLRREVQAQAGTLLFDLLRKETACESRLFLFYRGMPVE